MHIADALKGGVKGPAVPDIALEYLICIRLEKWLVQVAVFPDKGPHIKAPGFQLRTKRKPSPAVRAGNQMGFGFIHG
jgi:hypothetical protein